MSLISLQNISKTYAGPHEEVAPVKDLSLEIEEGVFMAIVGPSGSGKSTLLTIIGGMNPPNKGKVIIRGTDIYQLPIEARADFRWNYVGFVFQQLHLISYLTALENVMVPLAISPRLSSKEKEDMARRALRSVGLVGREHHLPSQLSGGEQGRVAVARALANNPLILLADEPTGNLDGRTGREVMQLLKALNEEGRAIVMVTHNEEAAQMARRIVTLKDGRLITEERDHLWPTIAARADPPHIHQSPMVSSPPSQRAGEKKAPFMSREEILIYVGVVIIMTLLFLLGVVGHEHLH